MSFTHYPSSLGSSRCPIRCPMSMKAIQFPQLLESPYLIILAASPTACVPVEQAVVTAFFYAIVSVMYYDIRIAKEGPEWKTVNGSKA